FLGEGNTLIIAYVDIDGIEYLQEKMPNGTLLTKAGFKDNSGQISSIRETYSDPRSGAGIIATYNVQNGQKSGAPTGFEVTLPDADFVGQQIATNLGSQLGSLLAGDSFLQKIEGQTVGKIVMSTLLSQAFGFQNSLLTKASEEKSLLTQAIDGAL